MKSPGEKVPDWHPTAWRRTPLQRLKFLQSGKQRTDAKGNAAKALSREVEDWLCLIRETDNVGRKSVLSHERGVLCCYMLWEAARSG